MHYPAYRPPSGPHAKVPRFPAARPALLSALLALLALPAWARATPDTAAAAAESAAPAAVSAPFPPKLPSREPWERWVNLPGTVLWFLPGLAMRGAGAAIGYVDEAKLIPKIHRVLVSEDGTRAVLPAYSVLTGGGVVFKKKDLLAEGSRLSLLAAAGEDWRHQAAFGFRRAALPGGFETDLEIDYRFLAEEIYFGMGPDARRGAAADYSHLRFAGEGTLAARQSDRFSVEVRGGLARDEILAGRDDDFPSITASFDEATAPGLSAPSTLAKGQVDLRLDSYDSPDPERGGEIRLSSALFNEVGSRPFAFARLGAHAEGLVPIVHGRKLALRLAMEKTLPLPDRGIPFHHLAELGRDGTVRGYTRGRFRDRDAAYGSAEYRWPIYTPHFRRALEFLLFADGGQVGRSLPGDFDADRLEFGYGAGLRYYGREGLISRLEMGASGERIRFYFSLN